MRLHYIDGLKAFGAIIVFFCHFNGLFSAFQISKAFQFINNGEYAVSIFLMLSGFSIALSLGRNNSWNKLQRTILFRYFRFAVPLAIVATIAYALYLAGSFRNTEVAQILGKSFGSKDYTNVSPFQYIASLVLSPMGYCQLNTPLWMLKFIFEGTFIACCLHIGIKDLGFVKKIIVLTAATILSAVESIYLADVVLGMMLFEIEKNYLRENEKHKLIRMIASVALLLFSLYIGNSFCRINGNIDRLSGIMITIGTYALILSVLLSSSFQHLLSTRPFRFFGSISFDIYIFHWIVVCSFSSILFLNWSETIPIWLNLLLTSILIVILSLIMTKWIEPRLVRPVETFLQKSLMGATILK